MKTLRFWAAMMIMLIAPVLASADHLYIGDRHHVPGWDVTHFSPAELACKGSGQVRIDRDMIHALDEVRAAFGRPIRITSGYRSLSHNAAVGGAKNSQHLHGKAVDIALDPYSSAERHRLMLLLLDHGFTSFGTYGHIPGMLHADTRGFAARWHHGPGQPPAWFLNALEKRGWQHGSGIR